MADDDRPPPGDPPCSASPMTLSLEKLSLSSSGLPTREKSHSATPGRNPTSPFTTANHTSLRQVSSTPSSPLLRVSHTLSGPAKNAALSPPQAAAQLTQDGPHEQAPPDATSLASDLLAKDLARHGSTNLADVADTIVILHDACYGHRFSRPRTPKAALGVIVERPERMRASALGIAAAYVRLGARHGQRMGAAAVLADGMPHPLGQLPFQIRKTSRRVSLLDQAVVAVHGTDWLTELRTMCSAAGEKLLLDGRELERAPGSHSRPLHDGDLYLCDASLEALEGAIGGVFDGVDAVFDLRPQSPRRAFVAIRPPGHHCAADFPSGFCWLNNVHVGIEYAAQSYGLTHAAILDFDLHHGDGSQDITWTRNAKNATMPRNASLSKKVAIGYYSMHDINSYPCEAGDLAKVQNASLCIDNAHGQSIWNVHLEPYKSQADFWELYKHKYSVLLTKARSFLRAYSARIRATPKAGPPKAAIFVSAGFDASQWEGAGMQRHAVNIPTDFYARFTADVVKMAREEDLGTDGRVISVLEGGYSDRALTSGVLSHLAGMCQSDESPEVPQSPKTTLASRRNLPIDSNWWSADNLEALESHITPPPSLPKKTNAGLAPTTYASPTTSSSRKVVDQEDFARSPSGTMRYMEEVAPDVMIPDVDWLVATQELSKLLIPTDRTTTSCKAEDLAPPRIKKEHHGLSLEKLPLQESPGGTSGRQLRERKIKTDQAAGPTNGVSTSKGHSTSPKKAKKPHHRTPVPEPTTAAHHSVPLTTPEAPVADKKSHSTTPARDRVTHESSSAQLDALSKGVRKLKLTVSSKEEWDRRQTAMIEAENKKKAEARRKARKLAALSEKKVAKSVVSTAPKFVVPVTPPNEPLPIHQKVPSSATRGKAHEHTKSRLALPGRSDDLEVQPGSAQAITARTPASEQIAGLQKAPSPVAPAGVSPAREESKAETAVPVRAGVEALQAALNGAPAVKTDVWSSEPFTGSQARADKASSVGPATPIQPGKEETQAPALTVMTKLPSSEPANQTAPRPVAPVGQESNTEPAAPAQGSEKRSRPDMPRVETRMPTVELRANYSLDSAVRRAPTAREWQAELMEETPVIKEGPEMEDID